MKEAPILKADSLKKTFSSPVPLTLIEDLSLEAYPGETIAIIGPSGSGKSTLLHILGTLEKPTSGTLYIASQKVEDALEEFRRKEIGFIFQSFHLLEDFTSLQNVLMPARIGRQLVSPTSSATKRAVELLELVSLKERSNHLVKLLSGGEKQRVAIARALMNDPSLILADEPTGNLDRATSKSIQSLLIEMAKKFHKTLIVVTHDQNFAKLCDRTFLLNEGKLREIHE